MLRRPSLLAAIAAVALVVVMVASGLSSAGASRSAAPTRPGPIAGANAVAGPDASTSAAKAAAGPAGASTAGSLGASARGRHAGPALEAPTIFPPNPHRDLSPGASPLLSTQFASSPAPMGVSDLGVRDGTPYTYATASFEGQLTLTSFSAFTPTNVTDVDYPTPDWAVIQLNTVAVNVSHFPGTKAGTFWIQNGVHFNGTTLQFGDNVWNFSSPSFDLPPSTLSGTHGSVVDSYVYVGSAAPIAVTLPLTLDLYNNITSSSGGPTVVTFGYYLKDPTDTYAGVYDKVTFGGKATSAPSQFEVNGSALNPAGLYYDSELIVGGNGGGSNANVLSLNGTERLLRWSGAASAYRPIPSAYDFGADSSETSLGIAEVYTGTTVRLTQGPSFLYGLWNTTSGPIAPAALPGWIDVRLAVSPDYALVFATNSTLADGALAAADYSYAPSDRAGDLTTDLPPPPTGVSYVFAAWAYGYAGANVSVSSNATEPIPLSLAPSPTTIDAPVYLLGSSQATAFGESKVDGSGYDASSGKLWLNASADALAAPFLRVNDYNYSTFQLVALSGVNLSLEVNGFHQAATTFEYTGERGTTESFPYWTQGYFFYGGRGSFSVQNVTVGGVREPSRSIALTYPPATILFEGNRAPAAVNDTSVGDAVGVTLMSSPSASVRHLEADDGSLGLFAYASDGLSLKNSNTSGTKVTGATLANVTASTGLVATGLTAGLSSVALSLFDDSGPSITGLDLESTGAGFLANASDDASVHDVDVGPSASAGNWTASEGLTFDDVTVDGLGLDLTDDSTVTVSAGSASGFDSSVVASFAGSSGGDFSSLHADHGAAGVVLEGCAGAVTLSSISAANGSVGAFVQRCTGVTASDISATAVSLGLRVNDSSSDDLSAITATDASAGAYVANSTDVKATGLTASNTTLATKRYFGNGTGVFFPMAAIGLLLDTSVTITGVSATDYPFAVASNLSTDVTVSTVTDWYGWQTIAFNATNGSAVSDVFGFTNVNDSVSLEYCAKTTVSDSTFENAQGVGVYVDNGTHDTIEDNNFVGDNGSSATGVFNIVHDQAESWNSTDPTFEGNYWSDRPATGAYVINNSASAPVKDATPAHAFTTTYVEFTEQGLISGTDWTLLLGSTLQEYTTDLPVLYVPGWAIPTGPLPFTVVPIVAYPPHPASGTLSWSGSSLVQPIVFGSVGSSSGLPAWWIYAAIGGVVVAVVVVVALVVRARRPRRGRGNAPGGEWSPTEGQ